jgi:hypothetical protein
MPADLTEAMTISSAKATQDNAVSKHDLPKMTVGTSNEYIEEMAEVVSHAMLPNAIWLRYLNEGIFGIDSNVSDEQLPQAYHSIVKEFLAPGMAAGAFIAEAGNFSACASWWPPGSHPPPTDLTQFDEQERQGKAMSAAFGRGIKKIQNELIYSKYGQDFWHLGLLGRDPRRPGVPGAVRAVLQPFIDQAAAEGMPIWLATTNERAKNIYLHFGWQVVGLVTFQDLRQWCMILYPPSKRVGMPDASNMH